MSRSYRKNPISSISNGKSEKDDKKRCNRILRRCIKQLVNQWTEVDEDFILPTTMKLLTLLGKELKTANIGGENTQATLKIGLFGVTSLVIETIIKM